MEKNELIQILKDISLHDSQQSFKKLYDFYYNRLFQQALYYLNQPDFAQEVVSDLFISIWQSRTILIQVQDPDAYFFIALKHAASRFIEGSQKAQKEFLTDQLPDQHVSDLVTDSLILDEEIREKYESAVNALPPRCAEVFRLVREERRKYAEVAEMLGISVKTVDNQMNKAVKILYQSLKDHLFCAFFHLLYVELLHRERAEYLFLRSASVSKPNS